MERLCAPLRCSCVSFGLCWVSLNLFVGSSGGLGGSLDGLGVVFKLFDNILWCSWNVFGALLEPLCELLEPLWSLFESSWSLSEGSWRRPRLRRTFIFKNGRPASTGARFSKPVRARTGSELQRERILSLGIKRELGRESEKTRREAKERITTRYLIPSYTRAWRHESKTASRLESPRA